MTFATPHCGSRRSTSSGFNSIISWVTRSFISKTGKLTLNRTSDPEQFFDISLGRQLMLEDTVEEFDNRPLLQAMADPSKKSFTEPIVHENHVPFNFSPINYTYLIWQVSIFGRR